MAKLTGEIKRGCLRTLYRHAAEAEPVVPLKDALDAFQDKNFTTTLQSGGRYILSHSGAGKSVTFAIPQIWQMMSPDEMFALTEELQEVYADALITLSAQGISTPTDQQIFDTMIADYRLATITTVTKDYLLLRYPTRY